MVAQTPQQLRDQAARIRQLSQRCDNGTQRQREQDEADRLERLAKQLEQAQGDSNE